MDIFNENYFHCLISIKCEAKMQDLPIKDNFQQLDDDYDKMCSWFVVKTSLIFYTEKFTLFHQKIFEIKFKILTIFMVAMIWIISCKVLKVKIKIFQFSWNLSNQVLITSNNFLKLKLHETEVGKKYHFPTVPIGVLEKCI